MLFGPKQRVHSVQYLTTVTDPNLRKALTIDKLSEHGLLLRNAAVWQTWLSREDRLCPHCPQNEVETELHFLTSCLMYDHIRHIFPSDYTDWEWDRGRERVGERAIERDRGRERDGARERINEYSQSEVSLILLHVFFVIFLKIVISELI